MSDAEAEIVATLREAANFPGSAMIVRTPSVIAEISGPLAVREGGEWLTIGEDGSSHLHLRTAEIARMRFSAPPDANAMLELLGRDGGVICKLSFRGTNQNRAQRYDPVAAADVRVRFAHLSP